MLGSFVNGGKRVTESLRAPSATAKDPPAMPELPEVEVTRRGLLPALAGQRLTAVVVRNPALRYPVPADLERRILRRRLQDIRRRGKYLLFDFGIGELLLHLGMSGSLRLLAAGAPAQPHDHVDLVFGPRLVRLHDPRRFGAVLWLGTEGARHPLLCRLGVEPLEERFSGAWLHAAVRGRGAAIKQVLMDASLVAGIGNIYASESLFRAGIRPSTPAQRLSCARCARLAGAIRETLLAATAAGGSSLRDFVGTDGHFGCFQQQYFVYGRAGEPCRVCGTPVRSLRMAQRSTFYCPRCQR
jgi:formamidopyrimidine-DNA glycosylase